jgi:hypothetical protein
VAYKRTVVGSVLKSKNEGETDYIKINEDVSFKKGDTLSLESKKSQLASLAKAVENQKMSQEVADKIIANVEKMPDFIRFNIVKVTKD